VAAGKPAAISVKDRHTHGRAVDRESTLEVPLLRAEGLRMCDDYAFWWAIAAIACSLWAFIVGVYTGRKTRQASKGNKPSR